VLWRLASYAAFDALEEANQDEKSDWGRLNREVTEFMDLPIGAQGTFSGLSPADWCGDVGNQLSTCSGRLCRVSAILDVRQWLISGATSGNWR
jgi:hypothetical protein